MLLKSKVKRPRNFSQVGTTGSSVPHKLAFIVNVLEQVIAGRACASM